MRALFRYPVQFKVFHLVCNLYFFTGLLAKWAMGVLAHFWVKDALFKLPWAGTWMRWVGEMPIDRRSPQGVGGKK